MNSQQEAFRVCELIIEYRSENLIENVKNTVYLYIDILARKILNPTISN
jgi:hypothetical protein